jgi:hypothetical protein
MVHYIIIIAMIVMFVGWKFFFLEDVNTLCVDFIYPHNGNKVSELVKKLYITIKEGVLNKFYNVIRCTFIQSMKQFYIMIVFTHIFLRPKSTKCEFKKNQTK